MPSTIDHNSPALRPLAVGGGGFAKAAQPFACGGFAACFASTIIHPIDLAKVRLQLFSTANPGAPVPSFPTLISNMIKEGGVGSIYAGIDASIMRQAIYGTARIGLHRTFSDMIEEKMAGNVPFWMKTASGMASGAIAVCIGTPMDVALVRMQSDSMKPEAERRHYKHVIDAMSRTAQEEGIGALWKGLYPNIGRGMAMNVGMLACYDQAKEVSSDRRNMARDDGRATTWPLPPPGPTRAVRPRPSSRTLPKPFLWLRSPRA